MSEPPQQKPELSERNLRRGRWAVSLGIVTGTAYAVLGLRPMLDGSGEADWLQVALGVAMVVGFIAQLYASRRYGRERDDETES